MNNALPTAVVARRSFNGMSMKGKINFKRYAVSQGITAVEQMRRICVFADKLADGKVKVVDIHEDRPVGVVPLPLDIYGSPDEGFKELVELLSEVNMTPLEAFQIESASQSPWVDLFANSNKKPE